jgi:hypothetical protein
MIVSYSDYHISESFWNVNSDVVFVIRYSSFTISCELTHPATVSS